MDADGTRDGYDLELTRAVADAVSVPVIASGGAGTLHIWPRLSVMVMRRLCWRRRSSFRYSHRRGQG